MVFLKVVLVGLASPRGLTVQCFPQEYFSPTPPFHFRCVGPYLLYRGYGGFTRCEREQSSQICRSLRHAWGASRTYDPSPIRPTEHISIFDRIKCTASARY